MFHVFIKDIKEVTACMIGSQALEISSRVGKRMYFTKGWSEHREGLLSTEFLVYFH